MKFKVGDRVRVVRRSKQGEVFWNPLMSQTIRKTYTILEISPSRRNLLLDTESDVKRCFYYPLGGVCKVKNQQLIFSFME